MATSVRSMKSSRRQLRLPSLFCQSFVVIFIVTVLVANVTSQDDVNDDDSDGDGRGGYEDSFPQNPYASIEPSKDLNWVPCDLSYILPVSTQTGDNGTSPVYECARLLVPFEHSDTTPNGEEDATNQYFTIAMVRIPATNTENYKGPLFFNFGGPGNPGTFSLPQLLPTIKASSLGDGLSSYDLVSFDPRAVGNTIPAVSCFTSKETIKEFSRSNFQIVLGQSNDSFVQSDAHKRLLATNCEENAADLIPYIGTVYAVEDLKWMTQAYGYSDKLSFVGISYGSILGMTYAAMYPDGVERMMLDAIVDPVPYYSDIANSERFADIDPMLQRFFEICFDAGAERCPFWFESVDAIAAAFEEVNQRLRDFPFIADVGYENFRAIDLNDIVHPIILDLYDPEVGFGKIAKNLAAIYNNDTTGVEPDIGSPPVLNLDYFLLDETANKPNGIEHLFLITCMDGPEWVIGEEYTLEWWEDYLLGEKVTQNGRYAPYLTMQLYGLCSRLSIKPSKRFVGTFSRDHPIITSAPILFLSSRLDPATPLFGAHIASSIFTNSAVVVNEDIGHGAIIYPSMCLGRIINKYLLDGTLPPNGTVCESEVKDPVERYFGDDGEGNDGGGEGLEKVEGLDQEAGMKYGK